MLDGVGLVVGRADDAGVAVGPGVAGADERGVGVGVLVVGAVEVGVVETLGADAADSVGSVEPLVDVPDGSAEACAREDLAGVGVGPGRTGWRARPPPDEIFRWVEAVRGPSDAVDGGEAGVWTALIPS